VLVCEVNKSGNLMIAAPSITGSAIKKAKSEATE
jgi:hypothetical protein